MIPINKDLQIKLNHLSNHEGAAALENLADALLSYYQDQCTVSEGVQLHRDQGAAQLARWLKTLPKGLRDGRNAT